MLVASFARPCGMFDNWFNKFTSFVTGGSFCHSEFVFSFPVARMREFLTFAGEDESEWQRKLERYEEDGMIHPCSECVRNTCTTSAISGCAATMS